ncbi:hypothetical protein AAKU58_004421, partial [Oxalobacteraceae bacterium GrIS 1.18]
NTSSLPLKFVAIGIPEDGDKPNKCNFKTADGEVLYEFLLTSNSDDSRSTAEKLFGRDICEAIYLPIDDKRFLIDYRGIGIVNLESKKYSRLIGPWVDDSSLSNAYQISPLTSVAVVESIRSKYVETHEFAALIFHKTSTGDQLVEVVRLIGSSAEYVDGQSGEPMCATMDEDSYHGPGSPPLMATAISIPRISVDRSLRQAHLLFTVKTKNCKTGDVSTTQEQFSFDEKGGKMTDQKGAEVEISSFE